DSPNHSAKSQDHSRPDNHIALAIVRNRAGYSGKHHRPECRADGGMNGKIEHQGEDAHHYTGSAGTDETNNHANGEHHRDEREEEFYDLRSRSVSSKSITTSSRRR